VKSVSAVLALGFVALIVQGALARMIPPPWCPDLAWLVVIGVGLRWPGFLSGMFLVVPLGYAMDLLSGSLMGQHAFMRLVSYCVAAVASRQLDLSGGLPVAIFVFGMTILYGLGIVATLSFFVGSDATGLSVVTSAIGHGIANVVAAGPMIALVERVVTRFSDEEIGRRSSIPIGNHRGSLG
jgi:cell shape-determining protein MreD